jgi:hypothetical protein
MVVAGRRVAVGRLGPELERIRRTQSGREYYTHDHLLRLAEFQARVPWGRSQRPGKQWCKQLHGGGKDCKLCSSCHFCRCGRGAHGGAASRAAELTARALKTLWLAPACGAAGKRRAT